MALRVTFELDDHDLKHFRLIMKEARRAAAGVTADDIVAAAEELLLQVQHDKVPSFISERMSSLRDMIDMLRDHEWGLPAADAKRVVNVLAYFCEPEDLIPDHVPGLGFLDDAIMIELGVRELRHEIDAYRDFCEFRTKHGNRGVKAKTSDVTREDWLADRRKQLQSRMRRRRSQKSASSGKRQSIF